MSLNPEDMAVAGWVERNGLLFSQVFDQMTNGFALCRMVFDDRGEPADWEYLAINPAYCRITGLRDVVGRRVGDLIPELRRTNREIFDRYAAVVRSGRPDDFTYHVIPLDLWLRVSTFRPSEGCFAVLIEDVTDRVRAEQSLRDNERLLDSIIENIPDMIFLKEAKELRFVRFNRAGEKLLGHRREDLYGRNDYDFFPPDQADHFTGKDREVLLAGRVLDIPAEEIETRTRGRRILHTKKIPLFDEAGRPRYLLGISEDVTESRLAEQELERYRNQLEEMVRQGSAMLAESEQKYRSLVETTNTGFVILDRQGRVVDANGEYVRMTGHDSLAEIAGQPVVDWLAPHDIARGRAALAEVLQAGRIRNLELDHAGRDGPVTPVEINATLVGGGQIQGLVRDISERRRAQQERDAIFNLSHDLICVAGSDGYFKYLNPAWEKVLGWPMEEMLSRPFLDFIHPDDHRRNDAEVATMMSGRPTLAFENRYLHFDGSTRTISWTAAPDPRRGLMYCIGRDVTLQRRHEAEMMRSQKLESVGLLAGGIAHDFNNLLTGILGNIQLARFRTGEDASVRQRLEEAEKAVERARKLTGQLLTFSRGGAPVRQPAHIEAMLRETAEFLVRGTACRCDFHIAGDLWAADVDTGQISQAVGNIVLNSVQAMPEGGTIVIAADNTDRTPPGAAPPAGAGFVRITIRDEGPGIPSEHHERIFDPYFTTKPSGSGLGLAVCHSVVRQHGGAIELESRPGGGATFRLYLPASFRQPDPEPGSPDLPAASRGRILLMDDDETIRSVGSEIIRSVGYTVDTATDGRQALERYAAARDGGIPYAAVILDLVVPGGMGGRETAQRLLEAHPEACLIVSSGYSNDPVMANYRDHGFCGVLPKPYLIEDVGSLLAGLLDKPDRPTLSD